MSRTIIEQTKKRILDKIVYDFSCNRFVIEAPLDMIGIELEYILNDMANKLENEYNIRKLTSKL